MKICTLNFFLQHNDRVCGFYLKKIKNSLKTWALISQFFTTYVQFIVFCEVSLKNKKLFNDIVSKKKKKKMFEYFHEPFIYEKYAKDQNPQSCLKS